MNTAYELTVEAFRIGLKMQKTDDRAQLRTLALAMEDVKERARWVDRLADALGIKPVELMSEDKEVTP